MAVVVIESKKVVRRDNVRLSNLMEHALCLLISQSEAENRGISECHCKRKGPAIVRVVQSNRKGNKTTSLIAPPITITLFPNSMLMKPALPCRNRWIVRGTPHDLLLRLQQEITRIRRLQKRPIAKMRKQMHKQLPCFGAQWELDVVVFDALHQEVESSFALGFGGGGDEGYDRVEEGVAEVGVLEAGAEEVGFYEEGEAGVVLWRCFAC